jgi:hypothetical protein
VNPLLTLIGIGGLALGATGAYFVSDYFADIRVSEAVQEEVVRQEKLCNAEIAKVQNTINTHALETVSAGNAALISLEPTPEDPEKLKVLCDKESACRDRKQP